MFTHNEIYSKWDNATGAGFLAAKAFVGNVTFFDNSATIGGNSRASDGGFFVVPEAAREVVPM